MPTGVLTEGIKELRRDLKAIDKALPRELTKALKTAAEEVLPIARALAPRRSGRLAASLRASGASNRASIRSKLPYANAVHWGTGARIGKPGPHNIAASKFVVRAVDQRRDQVVDTLGDAIDDLAKRHGFH